MRDEASVLLTLAKVPLILMSHESSFFSSSMFFGQLSMSSPKSVKLGVAVKLTPPDVAPMMSGSLTVAVSGLNDESSRPAFSWIVLNVSAGILVYFAMRPP